LQTFQNIESFLLLDKKRTGRNSNNIRFLKPISNCGECFSFIKSLRKIIEIEINNEGTSRTSFWFKYLFECAIFPDKSTHSITTLTCHHQCLRKESSSKGWHNKIRNSQNSVGIFLSFLKILWGEKGFWCCKVGMLINMHESTPRLNIPLLQGIIPKNKGMIMIITDPGRNTSIFKKKKVFQSSLSTHFRSYQSFYSSMITCADIPQSSFYQSRHIDARSFPQCIVKLIIADRLCNKKWFLVWSHTLIIKDKYTRTSSPYRIQEDKSTNCIQRRQ